MKKLFLMSLLSLVMISAQAGGNEIRRKLERKFYNASERLHIMNDLVVNMTLFVNKEGRLELLNCDNTDSNVLTYVTEKISAIRTTTEQPGEVLKYRLIIKKGKI